MEEKEVYIKAKRVAAQLTGIVREQEPEDLVELKEWLEENDEVEDVIDMLMDEHELSRRIASYASCDKERAQKLLRKEIVKLRRRLYMVWGSVAAAVVVLLFGGLFLQYSIFSLTETPVVASSASYFTTPTLVTASGENIDLSCVSGDSILYFTDSYHTKNEKKIGSIQDNRLENATVEHGVNRLIVPRQCNYQLTLCDGSIIHLNAESCLEYPTRFAANERRVRLIGEGYFEIKQDGRPFFVEARQVNIRVYGTKFNIKAYEPDNVRTVLVEGKIGVSLDTQCDEERILEPSQLSFVNLLTMSHNVMNTDIEKHISWVSGFFRYDEDRLEELVKDISRWYGIDFSFANEELKNICISASINKDASLEDIISMIQVAAKIKINNIERRYLITR